VGTGADWSTEVAVGIRKESSGSSKDMCIVSSTRRRCTGTEDMITQEYTVHRRTKRDHILTE